MITSSEILNVWELKRRRHLLRKKGKEKLSFISERVKVSQMHFITVLKCYDTLWLPSRHILINLAICTETYWLSKYSQFVTYLNNVEVTAFCNFSCMKFHQNAFSVSRIHTCVRTSERQFQQRIRSQAMEPEVIHEVYVRDISAKLCEHTCFCFFWRAVAKRITTISHVIFAYLPVRVKQSDSHWADIIPIKYLQSLLKYVKESRFWLK